MRLKTKADLEVRRMKKYLDVSGYMMFEKAFFLKTFKAVVKGRVILKSLS